LTNGIDSVKETPAYKWSTSLYSENKDRKGTVNCKYGGYLDEEYISKFDNDYFSITGREAKVTDPQQKMLMELTLEALEDGGQSTDLSRSRHWGVYIGIGQMDFAAAHMSDLSQVDTYTQTGLSHSIAPNRISNYFNLTGPSMAIDTACSSSLVALHLATNAIHLGECDAAVVGGVNLMLHPATSVGFSKLGVLSPDGKCHTFDASADGYVRGEGAGISIIKRLSDAIADGDHIYAVIKGSYTNEDGGGKPSLTTPSATAQIASMKNAYERSGVDPSSVYYVEAHGTGTPVGDATEATSIGTYFRSVKQDKLFVGSVKTNIGHLECASGMAALIKTALMINKRTLAPQLHFNTPNPKIDLEELKLTIVTESKTIEEEGLLTMGVNSFGFGGTNAHIILQEYRSEPSDESRSVKETVMVPLSARSTNSLSALAKELSEKLEQFSTSTDSTDILHKLSTAFTTYRTQHKKYRAGVVAKTVDEMISKLNAIPSTINEIKDSSKLKQEPVFVFAGQGPQWRDMGKQLYSQSEIYRATVDECDRLFTEIAGWSLLQRWQEVSDDEIHEPAYAQPGIFFLQIGLLELYKAKGVQPTAVVGHSMGEVASFYASGVISLESAVKVVYVRSSLQQRTVGLGNMLAIGQSLEQVSAEILIAYEGVEIASINSPASVVLAGQLNTLEEISNQLSSKKVFNRILRGKCGFHSSSQDIIREEVIEQLTGLVYNTPVIPLYSTVTGGLYVEKDDQYWWNNIRQKVNFKQPAQELLNAGYELFIEIGPHPVLTSSIIESNTNQRDIVCVATMKRQMDEEVTFTDALAQIYEYGIDVKTAGSYTWQDIVQDLELPTYPWNRSFSVDLKVRNTGNVSETICGRRDETSAGNVWKNTLSGDNYPFITDHKIQSNVIFPGAGYIVSCSQAALEHFGGLSNNMLTVENVKFITSLVVPDDVECQVQITNESNSVLSAKFWSFNQNWVNNSSMTFTHKAIQEIPTMDADELRDNCSRCELQQSEFYNKLNEAGVQLGPFFRKIHKTYMGQGVYFIELKGTAKRNQNIYGVDIPTLDAVIQSLISTVDDRSTFLPVSIEQIQFYDSVDIHDDEFAELYAYVEVHCNSPFQVKGDVTLFKSDGSVVLIMKGLEAKGFLKRTDDETSLTRKYITQYDAVDVVPETIVKNRYVIFDDTSNFAAQLASHFANSFIINQNSDANDILRSLDESDAIVFLTGMDETETYSVSWKLIQLMKRISKERPSDVPFWIVTKGVSTDGFVSDNGSLVGIGRSIRSEKLQGVDVYNVDISSKAFEDKVSTSIALYNLITSTQVDREFIVDNTRTVRVPRFISTDEVYSDEPLEDNTNQTIIKLKLTNGEPGSIDDVKFEESIVSSELGADQVEIIPYAAGLNFKDVMYAIGSVPSQAFRKGDRYNPPFSLDVAGIVHRVGKKVTNLKPGDEVLGLARGSLASKVVTHCDLVTIKPANMSWTDACTIPTVFLTAYYTLIYLARLEEGQSCLIHSATGGVGIAAIQIAQNICKAHVLATVGNQKKETYLRDNYGISDIFSSKSLEFADHITELTDGEGVDVILNSLDDEYIDKSLSILANMGTFLEIGVKDIYDNKKIGLKAFHKNISYHAFDLDRLYDQNPKRLGSMLKEIVTHFTTEVLRHHPIQVFSADKITDALKSLSTGSHIGKVAVDMTPIYTREVSPKQTLPNNGTYLITGGLKGIGLLIGEWLVEKQGITDVVLVGRSKPSNHDNEIIKRLQKTANVRVQYCDLSSLSKVRAMIRSVQKNMPALKTIFHLAAMYDNVSVLDLTEELLSQVLKSKATSAKNLHDATSNIELDQFFIFSSISATIGNMEQSAYSGANTVVDTFARRRIEQGFNAVSIGYGSIAAGLVASDYSVKEILRARGLIPVPINTIFKSIVKNFNNNGTYCVAALDWEKFSQTYYHLEPFFNQNYVTVSLSCEGIDYRERILALVAKAVGSTSADIEENYDVPLKDLGLDSITSIQLKNSIDKTFGTGIVTQMGLIQGMTAQDVEEKVKQANGSTATQSTVIETKQAIPKAPIPVVQALKPVQQQVVAPQQAQVTKSTTTAPKKTTPVQKATKPVISKTTTFSPFAQQEAAVDRNAYVYGIGTANPPPVPQKEAVRSVIAEYERDLPDYNHNLESLYENTLIETRHMCYDIRENSIAELREKGTYNEIYKKVAPELAARAALIALKQWGGDISEITHVVSCSCTGVIVPDVNFLLIEMLGLPLNVQRVSVNFMGCFGGLSTMRTAIGLASVNPKNRVLMVCTELSSIHYKISMDQDEKIGSSIFADGSAAMIVGCAPRKVEKPLYQVLNSNAVAIPNTIELMRWEVTPKGWDLGLSPQIPAMIYNSVPDFVKDLCKGYGITDYNEVDYTIHPGGKAILNAIEVALDVQSRERTISSWEILKNYGNMSSCTVLFVMNHLAQRSKTSEIKENVIGLAFGPGLSVEGVLMKNCQYDQ
jgi:acyl transferase domain-containing protein/predicted naringenin-chalcone synthase/NADPH:quinone reductase-like Zn-dependent oxidoreductase/NAD(P)-dependent dehydrogenase (short-subunit alcohol dehydrogenase family)